MSSRAPEGLRAEKLVHAALAQSDALKLRKQRLRLAGEMTRIPEGATEAANAVAKSLDAMVLVYSGPIDSEGFGHLIKALHPSDEQPFRQNLIMFLTTFGGRAGQAYQIARLLQTVADRFYLCVPSCCKSAGTLIALGANEIFMPSVSELGPLDVQLRRRDEIGQRRSGMVVRTALDGLAEETYKVFEHVMLEITRRSDHVISFDVASRVASEIAVGVMTPVYAQVDPESLGNDLRDLSVATAYGERLVRHGGNATRKTVLRLVEDYPTHEFIIDSEEAKGLFKDIEEPTDEMDSLITELGDIIYSVQSQHIVLRLDKELKKTEGTEDENTGAKGEDENTGAKGRR